MAKDPLNKSSLNQEYHLAKKIDACLDFLQNESKISLKDVATTIQIGDSNNLTFARNRSGKYEKRRKFSGLTRSKVLESLLKAYGLEIDENLQVTQSLSSLPSSHLASNVSSRNMERVLHFIYYFIGPQESFQKADKVERALFKVYQFSDQVEEAELVLFSQFHEGAAMERGRYAGKIYNRSASEKMVNLARVEGSGSFSVIHSTLVLRTGEMGFDQEWIMGTYVASGPVAGVALLQKVSEEQAGKCIREASFSDPYLDSMLFAKRVDLGALPNWIAGPEEIRKKIWSLEGLYYGYVLNHQEIAFRKFRMQINKDGTFQYESASNDVRKGLIVYDGKLPFFIFHSNHRPSLGTSELTFIIQYERDGNRQLYGAYVGWNSHNIALAGKIMLQRAEEKAFEKMESKYVRSLEGVQGVPELLDFYLQTGNNRPMVDSASVLAEILGIPFRLPASEPGQEKRFSSLQGAYRIYHLAASRDYIASMILHLSPNGDFEIKGYLEPNTVFKGRASRVFRTILSFLVQEKNEQPYLALFQFYLGERGNRKFHFLHGTAQFVTNNHEIVGARAVLFPVQENYQQQVSKKYPLPLGETHSKWFNDINRSRNGLGFFLMGETHNLIKPPRDPDKDLSRKERYAEIYFSSACYYAKRSALDPLQKGEHTNKCLEFLQRAFDHGFRLKKEDLTWIDKELTPPEGMLSCLPEDILSSIDWGKGIVSSE